VEALTVGKISDDVGGVAVFVAVAAGAAVAGLLGLSALAGLSASTPAPSGAVAPVGDLRPDVLPDPALRPWLLQAGALCPTISPAIVAAQVTETSGWDPAAQTTPGAQGFAQMRPAEWASWGRDDDANGNASPLDGPDALMALGREDCAMVDVVAPLGTGGGVGTLSLVLAAVKAGPDAVLAAKGIPPAPDVATYVSDVLGLAASYVSPPASTLAAGIMTAAESALGAPYLWGGGNLAGPSGGPPPGFDCSGLVRWAVWQASGGKVELPHSSEIQATTGRPVDLSAIQPGDVIAYQLHDPGDYDHIAIYVGGGQVIEAPDTGDAVKVQSLSAFGQAPSAVRRYSLP